MINFRKIIYINLNISMIIKNNEVKKSEFLKIISLEINKNNKISLFKMKRN
jgi:hypothetical protein